MSGVSDRLYMGEPIPADTRALRAWCAYHVRTEGFDRTLPGCWSPRDPTCWLPWGDFRGQSGSYARRLRDEVIRDLRADGVTDVEIEHGASVAEEMTYAQCEQLASSGT